jgi:cell division protein FtsB
VGHKDITARVLGRPLHSPYHSGGGRRSWWRVALLVAVGWLLYTAVLSDHSLWRILRLRQELSESEAELKLVQAETRRLEARLDDPRVRAEHAEEVLRLQGLAKPNEIIYRLGGTVADSTAR